jgi:hypothetical protein
MSLNVYKLNHATVLIKKKAKNFILMIFFIYFKTMVSMCSELGIATVPSVLYLNRIYVNCRSLFWHAFMNCILSNYSLPVCKFRIVITYPESIVLLSRQ